MKKPLLALVALLALLALSAQATEFRSADIHPDDYPTVQAVRFMGQELAKLSGGKHSIKVFSKSVLGSEKDTLEQVKLGAIAMTRVSLPQLNNICPGTVVPTLPFLFRDTAHLRAVVDSPTGEAAAEGVRGARLRRPGLLRRWLALYLHGEESRSRPSPTSRV